MSVSGEQDFVVHNMPAMMSRQVKRQADTDPNKWIVDESWHESVRETYFHLFLFLQDYGLVRRKIVSRPSDVDAVILRLSDFTDEGRAFVMAQVPHKWLASFDRPGSRKLRSDVSYLERELKKQRSAK